MSQKTAIGKILKYLARYYKFELNELTGVLYYQRRDSKSKRKPFDRAYFVRLLSDGMHRYHVSAIREALKAINYKPVNPVKEFLNCENHLLPKLSPFKQLDKYFTIENDPPFPFSHAPEMHIVRAVRGVLSDRPNRFIFTLVSKQEYIGKTEFLEWLFPIELRDYCMSTLSGRKE